MKNRVLSAASPHAVKLRPHPARRILFLLTIATLAVAIAGCAKLPPEGENGEPVEMRLGYFPNVTHAQAMIGVKRGDFQKSIGPDVKLTPYTFNAGPAVIEAIYAGHLDLAYVGPSPAINGFLQSKGEEVRVVAGSAVNGVSIIGNKVRGITSMKQLKGGRIATPQYANTQDISARYFLTQELGAHLKSNGGETDIIPIANPDIETLLKKNQIDAAWVPEPWGSRLVFKNLGVIVKEEKDLWPNKSFAMTNVIARRGFVEKYPDLVSRFLKAHIRITRELQKNPQAFAGLLNDELKRITTKSLPPEVIAGALDRTGFNIEPAVESFQRYFMMAKTVGITKADSLDVDKLFTTEPLTQALASVDSTDSAGATVTETTATRKSARSDKTTTGLDQ